MGRYARDPVSGNMTRVDSGGGVSADNFIGTKQEWEALTPQEQAKYKTMDFFDNEGGGGGGTSNYDDLRNKPQINGVELSGNKTAEDLGILSTLDIGEAGGVAELDVNGKVPSSQLPSYVDDVIEGYYNETDGKFYEESTFETEIPGEAGKTFVDIAANKSYRWSGSAFVRVDEGVQLGENSSSAYRGDRGKIAYDDSQSNKAAIGTLSNLDTTEKSNLVGAINEVKDSIPEVMNNDDVQDVKDAFNVNRPIQFVSNPVGCIIQMMGVTAPVGYLACDGTAYNIADYPVLAAYFEAQFGTKNHFGGDGTTTFAVPNLQGEFLRGSGTNSHADQGSGAAVGTHQDSTKIPSIFYNPTDGTFQIGVTNSSGWSGIKDIDKNISPKYYGIYSATSKANDTTGSYATVRPTNTSVLFCIKY